MTTSRLAILLAVLLAGMSSVLLLPKQLSYQPVGIELQLPQYVGEWLGTDLKVSDKELTVLGPGTEFSRKNYTNGRGDELQVSIVLAGQDMNTSIHRPERCLPAQGWTITDKKSVAIAVPDEGRVGTTRLHAQQSFGRAGERPVTIYNLNYYWFVGNSSVTASHFERTWIDIKDRLLHGYNQRWAYVTVVSNISKETKRFGRDEAQTDEMIQVFMKQLVPIIHKDTVKPG